MSHLTVAGTINAYQIEIAGKMAVMLYAGKDGVDPSTIELPAPFTIIHGFYSPEFTYCNWLSEFIDQIYEHGKGKPDMKLRKLLYCLEDECHYLCDNTRYDGFVVGLVYPEEIDFTENRKDFGFCEEEVLFGELSEQAIPYKTAMTHPGEFIADKWNKGKDK